MTTALPQVAAAVRYKLRTVRRVLTEAAGVGRREGFGPAAWRLASVAGQLLRWYHPARVWQRHRKSSFDLKYRVNTSGLVHPSHFAAVAADGADPHHYKAIRPEDFHAAVSALAIRYENFEFVDYGSGKGRALLLASEYPFRRITGVEFSRDLHRIALHNIVRFNSPRQRCFGIRSICDDAGRFDPPESPCVLYFYDPFGERLMSAVLERIAASLARRPREIYIVYCQPRLSGLLDRQPFLERAAGGEHFAIFRAAPLAALDATSGAGVSGSRPGQLR